QPQRRFLTDGRTIAGSQFQVIEIDFTAENLKPGETARRARVGQLRIRRKRREEDLNILIDFERAFSAMRRSDQPQTILSLLDREGTLLVAGGQSGPLRNNPDLIKMDRFGLRCIELTMLNPRTR